MEIYGKTTVYFKKLRHINDDLLVTKVVYFKEYIILMCIFFKKLLKK